MVCLRLEHATKEMPILCPICLMRWHRTCQKSALQQHAGVITVAFGSRGSLRLLRDGSCVQIVSAGRIKFQNKQSGRDPPPFTHHSHSDASLHRLLPLSLNEPSISAQLVLSSLCAFCPKLSQCRGCAVGPSSLLQDILSRDLICLFASLLP